MNNILTDFQLTRLSEYIETHLALKYAPERWRELETKMERAAKELGFEDTGAFAEDILSSGATIERLEVLAGHLTTGETYFWREPMVFEALETRILPELTQARRESGGKYLRLWSAGCSSGEEAYSLAIALRRSLPDIEEWNVSVLATDINPRMLQKAKAGLYGEWSFRNSPPWLIPRYFGEQRGGKREIAPELRGMVSFEYLNLSDDIYPSPLNDTQAMDIILCRNVLMYFTADRARQIVGRLRRALSDSGWLAVAACELSMTLFSEFELVSFPDSPLYRKLSPPYPPSRAEAQKRPRVRIAKRPAKPPAAPARARPPRPRLQPVSAGTRKRIEELADQGRLAEALSACDSAIDSDKLDPRLHFLKAAILQEMNREQEAAVSLRRIIYLDPKSLSANFSLGNLLLRNFDEEAARRYFRHTLVLLDGRGDDDVLPDVGGLTVKRFREILGRSVSAGRRLNDSDSSEGEAP